VCAALLPFPPKPDDFGAGVSALAPYVLRRAIDELNAGQIVLRTLAIYGAQSSANRLGDDRSAMPNDHPQEKTALWIVRTQRAVSSQSASAAMQIFYSDTFVLPLPEGHRFPMRKYAMLRERVAAAHLVPAERLQTPPAAAAAELGRAHSADYIRRVQAGALTPQEIRRIGFPWSPAMVERSRRSVGATIAACRAALDEGVGVNLAGGTHHAFADAGAGFCVFNDSAVAARAMQAEGRARRILIVDCDVHQGDGTAAILAGDPTIYTFSIHGAKNFPFRKQHSDLDIELPDHTPDGPYLDALESGLHSAIAAARADLVIYLAGADPYYDDRLGRLALTKAGLAARDQLVFEYCRTAGLPIAISMAGGYARTIDDTVDIQFQTITLAAS
jgi:acetoin utilization deacetylase AcuC-like enzyme